ncbi:MAG: branched-chain amino acid ABC transporter permease [Planctomycetota bacterium]
MFFAVFACIAGLALRGAIWGALGWEGGSVLTAGRLAAGAAAGLGGGTLAGVLALALGETHLGRASRIAGLLTALGISLFLQTFAMRLWTAAERGCRNPFERRYYSFEEAEKGEAGDVDLYYSVREGWRTRSALLAAAGETPSDESLAAARGAGAKRVFEELTVPAGRKQLLVLLVAAISTAGLWAVVKFTRYGKAMRALSEDADAARLVGVNPDRVIAFTFFLGAALAGVAGVLIATYYGSVKPMMGYAYGIKAFIAAVAGGIGSVPGACVGGLVLGVSERLFGELFPQGAARDVAAFGLLILILLVRPAGILGRKELRRT